MYEIKIDPTATALQDSRVRVRFEPRDPRGKQRYVVRSARGSDASSIWHTERGRRRRAGRDRRGGDDSVGPARLGRTGRRSASDLEPDVLHAVGHAFQDGTAVDLSKWVPRRAKNLFAGHTVYSIVLEVPDALLLDGAHGRRIGVWAIAVLATDAGGWRSINRAGLPMIHPLFTQYDEGLGTASTAGAPRTTSRPSARPSSRPLPASCRRTARRRTRAPTPRGLRSCFLPNILPYEVGTPAVFGVGEWELDAAYRQCAGRDVFDRGERARAARDWQGVGDVEAVEDLSVRACRAGGGGGGGRRSDGRKEREAAGRTVSAR